MNIVERLRSGAFEYQADGNLLEEAADEIERLRRRPTPAEWEAAISEIEDLREDCERYEAMQRQIAILEMERNEAREAAAAIWDGGISSTEALDRWSWLEGDTTA